MSQLGLQTPLNFEMPYYRLIQGVAFQVAVLNPSQPLRVPHAPLSSNCLRPGGFAAMQAAFVLAWNHTVLADSSYASQRTADRPIFERKWQLIVV